jgi:hypothetical protein
MDDDVFMDNALADVLDSDEEETEGAMEVYHENPRSGIMRSNILQDPEEGRRRVVCDNDLLEIPDWALSPLGGGTYACTIGDENCIPAHHPCVHLAAAWSKAGSLPWPRDSQSYSWRCKILLELGRRSSSVMQRRAGIQDRSPLPFLGSLKNIKSECGNGERDWDTCQLRGDFGSLNRLTFGYKEDDPGAVWLKDRSEDYMHGYTNDTHLKRPDVFPNLWWLRRSYHLLGVYLQIMIMELFPLQPSLSKLLLDSITKGRSSSYWSSRLDEEREDGAGCIRYPECQSGMGLATVLEGIPE